MLLTVIYTATLIILLFILIPINMDTIMRIRLKKPKINKVRTASSTWKIDMLLEIIILANIRNARYLNTGIELIHLSL